MIRATFHRFASVRVGLLISWIFFMLLWPSISVVAPLFFKQIWQVCSAKCAQENAFSRSVNRRYLSFFVFELEPSKHHRLKAHFYNIFSSWNKKAFFSILGPHIMKTEFRSFNHPLATPSLIVFIWQSIAWLVGWSISWLVGSSVDAKYPSRRRNVNEFLGDLLITKESDANKSVKSPWQNFSMISSLPNPWSWLEHALMQRCKMFFFHEIHCHVS